MPKQCKGDEIRNPNTGRCVKKSGKIGKELLAKSPLKKKSSSKKSVQKTPIQGRLITKEKRAEIFGNVAGGANSCAPEHYQRKVISEKTGIPCKKTNTRINLRTHLLAEISQPNRRNDGFDYSEDFDGAQKHGAQTVYINLKCIVGAGGSQTRSLREVYWFVEGQLNVLKNVDNVVFVNILDGDEADKAMKKFDYLVNLPEFSMVKDKVYVGDLRGYLDWFKTL